MSVTRLLISGLLVASGLILAAFTLHGAFDGFQIAGTAGGGPALKPWSTNTFGAGGSLVAASAKEQDALPTKTRSPKSGAKGEGKGRINKRKRTEKRPADQAQKAKQKPQQTASQWPWSWFSN